MVKRGGLEEMCSLLMLVAQEEEQRLASAPGFPGLPADDDGDAADVDAAARSGARSSSPNLLLVLVNMTICAVRLLER